jgi:hypothetical protein
MDNAMFEKMLAQALEAKRAENTNKQTEEIELLQFDSYAEQIDELMKIGHRIVNPPTKQRKWIPGLPGYEASYVGRQFNSWQEVKRAAESAWPEGLALLQKLKDELADVRLPQPQNLRRQARYSEDTGDEICLDRLRRQLPYWRTTHRDHRPGPLSATILTDLATVWSQSSESILWRGAATICLTNILEQAGYRVEIWTYDCTRTYDGDSRDLCIATCLKRGSDPLDESSLVNSVSGWSFRTITFGSHWHCHEPKKNVGRIADITPFLVKQITPDENVLNCHDIWEMKSAVKWVREMLSNFDVQGVRP